MKILLTNNTLSWLGGSETATYAIATELKRQNDNVTAFSDSLGQVSDRLEANNVKCIDNLKEDKFDIVLKPKNDLDFDVIFANHNAPANIAAKYLPTTPMIFTSHGLIWKDGDRICPEHPPIGLKNIIKYVAVSEEVAAKYKENGVDATVIRNGIDLERFKPTKPLNDKLKRILIITNWWGTESKPAQVLGNVVREMGIEVLALGVNWQHQWDTENVMNQVDLVISYGRGALEAMSCGRPALIYGHNGCDGIVTPDNYDQIKLCNFSGRRFAEEWDEERLKEELSKYNPKMGEDARKLMEENHDIKEKVKQYKEIFNVHSGGLLEGLGGHDVPSNKEQESVQEVLRDTVERI